MSPALNDNDEFGTNSNRIFNRLTNTYIRSDSIILTNPAARVNEESPTWVDSLVKLDRMFLSGMPRLCYNIIDVVLLCLGVYYGSKTWRYSNVLIVLSIVILVFSGLKLISNLVFVVRNWCLDDMNVLGEESTDQMNAGKIVRALFQFFRFVCVCVGSGCISIKITFE